MKKQTKKKERRVIRKIHAFGIVGKYSKRLYLNSNLTKYQVFLDGFVAENKQHEYKGRGQQVELIPVTIIYKF